MQAIDLHHTGIERAICCWQIGEVLVDPGPESSMPTLLEALGDARPRALLLTHIHLDHAAAAGALVQRWPNLEVYVHERGAPHVIDPSKLLASATRLYGDEGMARLWGNVVPVPAERVQALTGGESIDLEGGFRVLNTPGHASHHVSYLHEDSGRAFVGDVAGVRIPPSALTIAPTPPPDIDVEAWEDSLDRISAWQPASLALTHFGAVADAPAQLDAVRSSLRGLAEMTRNLTPDAVEAAVRNAVARATDGPTARAYEHAISAAHLHAGLARYWSKRSQPVAHTDSA